VEVAQPGARIMPERLEGVKGGVGQITSRSSSGLPAPSQRREDLCIVTSGGRLYGRSALNFTSFR
jgi:hypothetical protein